jgi:hypothetical protein
MACANGIMSNLIIDNPVENDGADSLYCLIAKSFVAWDSPRNSGAESCTSWTRRTPEERVIHRKTLFSAIAGSGQPF